MSDTQAKIEITASTSRLPAALARAKKMFQGFAETVGGGTRDMLASIGKGVLFGAGMNVANRGLDLMIDQGKKVIDFQRELTRLGIDLRKQPGEMQSIGLAMREISNQTGLGADSVLSAGRAYADLAGAEAFTMDRMRLIARSAQASGTDVSDMAALMFTLTENMKVPDNQLEDTIGGLINQAKDGSIHFKELAKELVALGSVYSQFGVTGREGAIQIGAQMQLARHGFASASEAATGILRIYRSLPQHASKFAKSGVDIWMPGSKTQLRPFEDIIHQIQKSKLALNREALIKSFGRTEGERFYQILTALAGQYDALKIAGQANGVVQKDLATYTESAAGRIDVAVERMKNGFAEALTPERIDQIVGGIEQIVAAMPAIVSAISTVMDAFSGMVLLMRKGGDIYSGLKGYKPTPEEIHDSLYTNQNDPKYKEVNQRLNAKRDAYSETMNEIIGSESATGPSQASIANAVANLDRKGPLTAGQEGAKAAADAYLKDRGISPYVLERVRGQIAAREGEQAGQRLAARAARPDAAYDRMASSDAFAEQMRNAVKDGVVAAMQSRAFDFPTPIPTVRLNGDNVGVALENASRYRRR